MVIAGIDPGVKGALVVLAPSYAAVLPMPLNRTGKGVDGAKVAAWLLVHEVELVVLERVQARNTFNTNGKAIRKTGNEFRFATGYGVMQGVVMAMGIPLRLVQPLVWQGAILAGYGVGKQASIRYVQDNLPEVNLTPGRTRTPQDGVADAACLAVYGRDHLRRGE